MTLNVISKVPFGPLTFNLYGINDQAFKSERITGLKRTQQDESYCHDRHSQLAVVTLRQAQH